MTKKLIQQDGALREDKSNKLRYDLIPLDQFKKLVKHYTDWGIVHWDRNWESGWLQYAEDCKKSAWRHFIAWQEWQTDEDHLSACIWNMWWNDFLVNKNTKVIVNNILTNNK